MHMAANYCCPWLQKFPCSPKATNFCFLTSSSRCKEHPSKLPFRYSRSVSVISLDGSQILAHQLHWQRNSIPASVNTRHRSIFAATQRRFLGHFKHQPLPKVDCIRGRCMLPLQRIAPACALHSGSVNRVGEKRPKSKDSEAHGSVLMEMIKSQEQQPKQLTVGAKVVQAGKDFSYLMVIIAGFAVAGFLFWSVGSEFFSQNSPSVIYSRALKRIKSDPRIIEVLGEPISGHGAPSGRGRRRDVLHQEYIVDDVTYMRVKFYVDGSKRRGTVHVDLKKNAKGKYECRFLFVELKGHPPATIVLEDNRHGLDSSG